MNDKQKEAYEIIKHGHNLFLTGSAGTGKSYTLKSIIDYLEKNNIEYGLTALTGCASVLINGQTIHSFLYMGISKDVNAIYNNLCKFTPKLNKLKKLKVLIIDEISMMDDKLFETINQLLMLIKGNDKLFGGVRLLLVGDFYQLPPISGDYCFTSDIWSKLNLKTVILTELIRQKDDNVLQHLLEEIRNGKPSEETMKILENLKNTTFSNKQIKPTRLYPINKNVDKINNHEFNKLLKKNNNEKILYKAYCNKSTEKIDNYNIELTLHAQVMVIRNISIENKLFNGTRGIIIELNERQVVIRDIYNNNHTIEYYTDLNNNNKKIMTSFMPLKLAYAISIHKSQGASIDYLELDLGEDIFISGQLYTALSRATNINNIKIINFSKNSFIQNEKIKKFYNF
jgi:ATP-dependent exoDNAse (exonuclease V) alpha subunit